MADTLTFRIVGSQAVADGLNRRAARVQTAAMKAMQTLVTGLESHIVREKLSGQVLHRRSGVLSGAVHGIAGIGPGGRILGRVSVGRQAWYGKIHEYGG